MKEVRAIIRPQKLAKVRDALRDIPNFPGVTLLKAEGFTAPASTSPRSIAEELTDFVPKVVVSVICSDDMADTIEQTIIDNGTTGQIGDGLVWTLDILEVRRVRNGTVMDLDHGD
jgi:nitrogen regulatory protein P-II 1